MLRAGSILTFVLTLFAGTAIAWQGPHGDSTNTNYAAVPTQAATTAPVTVPGIGTFGKGAGPVVGPDGTVVLGNQQGEVIALHPDGKPYWRRSISGGQTIDASPAISSDGTIFVIGNQQYTDTSGSKPIQRTSSMLHRFTSSGGYLGQTPLPEEYGGLGAAGGAPNIWNYQGAEMVVVIGVYKHVNFGGHYVYLFGFDVHGGVIAATKVTTFVPTVTGGGMDMPAWKAYTCLIPPFMWCTIGEGFEANMPSLIPPPPSAGVFTYAGGGTPFILVSDHLQDIVGYTFENGAFVETFRKHDKNLYLRSAPVTLPSGHTIVGYEKIRRHEDGLETMDGTGGVVFAGPAMQKIAPITGLKPVYATPTRMADGRVILLGWPNQLAILQGTQVTTTWNLPGETTVSAAASSTHVFVSTTEAFLSYDTNSLAEVGNIPWVGGGSSPPAIGPGGEVYAIASNILFVFPKPKTFPMDTAIVGQPVEGMVETDPNAQPQLPPSQRYQPPLTQQGNRLFACEKLDGDDCGKGDYKTISLAWCQKQGYPKVADYDVDSRKVTAETLDGHFCSKKKCKVFDTIDCTLN